MRRTKEGIVFLSCCELHCLFNAGWCVSEIGGVAWCELYHGGYKNSGLFDFS